MKIIKYFSKNIHWLSIDDITKENLKPLWTYELWFEYTLNNQSKLWKLTIFYNNIEHLFLYEVFGKITLWWQTKSIWELRELIKKDLRKVWFKENNQEINLEDFKSYDFSTTSKTIYLMIWLPWSWKSTYLKNLNLKSDSIVLGLDLVRKDLYWDEIIQWDWSKVFWELQRRIKNAISNTQIKNIYIDNTNLYRKMRKEFISYGSNDIKVIWLNFIVPFSIALDRNNKRVWKVVPEDVMFKMMNLYQEPSLDEWFSEIITINSNLDLSNIFIQSLKEYINWNLQKLQDIIVSHSLFKRMIWFEQTSQYHQENLVEHLEMIWAEIYKEITDVEDRKKLLLLNIFHDTWKLTTREKKVSRVIREKEYVQIDWELFLDKNWKEVIVKNYDDYQFIWHENVSKNIFIREFEKELVKNWIILEDDVSLYRTIIEYHLLFHKWEKLWTEPLKSLDENIKRLWRLFSKFDSLWRIWLLEEY